MQRKFINLQHFAEETGQEGTLPAQNPEANPQQENNGDKPKYTEEDVNKLINKKFAEWSKKKEKEVSEAQKLAAMNAQEQAEYQRDQLQKKLDELKQKEAISEMSKTARKMLSENGINAADELLAMLVTANAEETKAAVNSFTALFKDSVKSAVAEALKGPAPKTGTSSGITKEQIMAIKDRRARQKAINENLELF